MLLITIFVELHVVDGIDGRSHMRAGSQQPVSWQLCCAVALRRTAWSEHGMGAVCVWPGKCESDTAALCKSNGKDTFQTLSGRALQGNNLGTAWTRHLMCGSTLKFSSTRSSVVDLSPQYSTKSLRLTKFLCRSWKSNSRWTSWYLPTGVKFKWMLQWFTDCITCKVKCKCKKFRSHTNYILKVPPKGSKFTLKLK